MSTTLIVIGGLLQLVGIVGVGWIVASWRTAIDKITRLVIAERAVLEYLVREQLLRMASWWPRRPKCGGYAHTLKHDGFDDLRETINKLDQRTISLTPRSRGQSNG